MTVTGRLKFPRCFSPLVWLGNLSFAIYVVHQTPGLILIGRLQAAGVDPAAAVAGASLAAIGLGALIHYGFEVPARRDLPILAARMAGALEPKALIDRIGSAG